VASQSLPHQNTRVAIYARVSTKDKGQEVENQLRQLREFSALQGWTMVREFVDRESGSRDDRAEFPAMFRDATNGNSMFCCFGRLIASPEREFWKRYNT